MTRLLALRRPEFEAAMKDSPDRAPGKRSPTISTIAYTDIVAALELLSAMGQAVPMPTWQNVHGRKREFIDAALEGADECGPRSGKR